MIEYTIMYFNPVDKKVKKFIASEIDINLAGVWTFGYWSEEGPKSAAKYFFPMDKIKFLKEGIDG